MSIVRVPDDLHRRPRRHAEPQQHRHAPCRKSCSRTTRTPAGSCTPSCTIRVQFRGSIGVPIGGREHEAETPATSRPAPPLRLLSHPGARPAPRTTIAGSGIVRRDRAVFVGITWSADRRSAADHAGPAATRLIQVDVLPAQSEHLAAPHPEQREDHQHRVQPVVPRRRSAGPGLPPRSAAPAPGAAVRAPAPASPAFLLDQLLPHRVLQGGPERRVHVLDRFVHPPPAARSPSK